MTSTLTPGGFTEAAFEAFLSSRREPPWMTRLRREAYQVFADLPLPGRALEQWRRTDVRRLKLDRFTLPAAPPHAPDVPPPLLREGVTLAGRAATFDGHQAGEWLDPELARQGVLFGSLDRLLAEHGERLRPYLFGPASDPFGDKFTALHAAFWHGGTLLLVPRGVAIEQPLHMVSALSDGKVDLGHTLVVLEEGAQATLLAETASRAADEGGLHCGAVELLVGPGAALRYVNLQNWGHGVWHFADQKAVVERDGRVQWTIGALGARLAKVNQQVALVGEDAEAQVNGVMFTEGHQHLAYITHQHHAAARCRSDLLYKAALQDRSQVVWRGMIKVDPGAQKTDGYQRNDVLMLSDAARGDSIPGLEIEADDVRCSHGATVGRVDDEQIFYAQSRGLTRKEAVRLVVAGFFQQVFDRITIDSVREALGQAIGRRIREYQET